MSAEVYIVVVAAGRGERMGGERPKQVLALAGEPLALYSLRIFAAIDSVKEIVLVENSHVKKDFDEMLLRSELKKNISRVEGGATRQASVLAGLRLLLKKNVSRDALVLIHDAARPLVTERDVKKLVAALITSRAAILASRSADTLKQISNEGIIEKTLDRSAVWCASTPQGARLGDLLDALGQAEEKHIHVTDEASALEIIDVKVNVVEQSDENFKITTAADLMRAEAVIEMRSRKT